MLTKFELLLLVEKVGLQIFLVTLAVGVPDAVLKLLAKASQDEVILLHV